MDAWWWPILAAPFIGSFAGVLIRRLPADEPVFIGRSHCESCGRPLGATELIPLISFFVQRGRCRRCGAAISRMHLWVELAAVAIAGSAALAGHGAALWAGCGLGWTLMTLAWIDVRALWLPDALTLPLIVAGLTATWLLAPDALADHALASVIGYAAFRGVGWLYARLRGREGLGQGDAKLLAAGGAWLGVAALPAVLLVSAGGGLAIAFAWQLIGRAVGRATAIPFGPPLAGAIWVCWLLAASPKIEP